MSFMRCRRTILQSNVTMTDTSIVAKTQPAENMDHYFHYFKRFDPNVRLFQTVEIFSQSPFT